MEKELMADPIGRCHRLRVAKVMCETADACSIVFEVPPELEALFRYRAGQFLTLQVPFEGKVLSRCYSLSSSPECDSEYQITVKRVADGRISNWLNDHVEEGGELSCMPPGGLFVLHDRTDDLVLFAAGSGITPVLSLVKSALATTQRRIRLVYANRDKDSVIFATAIARLAAANSDRLDVVQRFDDQDGFVEADDVRGWVADRGPVECYVCGPSAFMNVVERALIDAGVDQARIHIERFVSPPDPGAVEKEIEEQQGQASSEGAHVSVSLDGKLHSVAVEPGQTVLAASQAAGLRPPFSCTEGFCGCCMAKVVRGQVRMKMNDFLSKKEVEQGWVLTCQAVPISADVEVRYPD